MKRPNLRRWAVEPLEDRRLLAVGPELLTEVGDNVGAYRPQSIAFGNSILLSGEVNRLGVELLIIDQPGTDPRLVKDIFPGSLSSAPGPFVQMGASVFFYAEDVEHGRELWRTDGTSDGTYLVADVFPGSGSSISSVPAAVGDHLFFSADDGIHGAEPWVSDGTAAGTHLISDLALGTSASSPAAFTEFNDSVYFFASGQSADGDLWRTSLAGEGVALVSTVAPGSITPRALTASNGFLYFTATVGAYEELWRTDGVTTVAFLDHQALYFPRPDGMDTVRSLVNVDGKLFFQNADRLWVTNGTSVGTSDLGTWGAPLASFRGKLLTNRLGISDGTPEGTFDLRAGGVVHVTDDTVFFVTNDNTSGHAIWRTDGTADGTLKLMDYPAEPDPQNPRTSEPLVFGSDRLYFEWDDGTGYSLWSASNSEYGQPRREADIIPSSGGPIAASAHFSLGTRDYLLVSGVGHLGELWATDGTSEGTTVIDAAGRDRPDYMILQAASVGLGLLMNRDDGTHGWELWASDGTAGDLRLVKDIAPGPKHSNPQGFWDLGSTVLFEADDGEHGFELWRTDGTAEGTWQVKDIQPGPEGSRPVWGKVVGGILYFSADDGEHGRELWRSDGTEVGTYRLTDIAPSGDAWPEWTTEFAGQLYFSAEDSPGNKELWRTDGTVGGTVRVKDINPGSAGSQPSFLQPVGDKLFFVAGTTDVGRALWVTDGTDEGTRLVKDLDPSTGMSVDPERLLPWGDKLVFLADDGVHGGELWLTDGLETGTTLLKDIRPGSNGSWPRFIEPMGDRFVFAADDGIHGNELWVSDGTAEGTYLWQDLDPRTPVPGTNIGTLNPEFVGTVDGHLLFTAEDGYHGRELWTVPYLNVAPTDIILDQNTVAENASPGVVVGQLSAVDDGGAHTFALVNDAGGRFQLAGDKLIVASATLDYETKQSYVVRVLATDSGGLSFEKDLTIQVTNVNEAPFIIVPPVNFSSPGGVLPLSGISVSDPDLLGADLDTKPLRLALTADHGTVQFGSVVGLTIVSGVNGSPSVTVEGPVNALNAALGTLTHKASLDFSGLANVAVDLNDLGHSGEGSPLSTSVALGIHVDTPPVALPDHYQIGFGKTLNAQSYSQAVLDSGPLAYWRLGDSGPLVEDSVGNHHGTTSAATVLGLPGALAGDPNKAASFPDVNSRILVAGAESLAQPTGAFSVEAWVNPSESLAWQRIASTRNGPNGGWGFALSNQRLAFTTYGIQDYFLEGHPVPTNQWSHVAVVFDTNHDASFYLNGAFVGKIAGSVQPNPGGSLFAIGDNPDQSAQPFLGKLDEVAFYAKSLTAADVSRHYQAGLLNATVLVNDTDADGDPLHALLVAQPQHGQLTFGTDGSFTYKPNAGYYGQDKFTYRAVDLYFQSAETEVLIDVIPVPGDADLDGDVDLADFGILKQFFGTGTTREQGDFNGDGKVDLADFGLLKQRFGTVEPPRG